MHKTVKILGLTIDSTNEAEVLRFVRARIEKKEKFFVVTPNPEQVLIAQGDEEYKRILNSATLKLCDGIGLVMANKFLNLPTTDNALLKPLLFFAQGLGVGFNVFFDRKWLTSEMDVVRGREAFFNLIDLANKKKWSTVLVGDNLKSAQKAMLELKKNYKGIIMHALTGPMLADTGKPRNNSEMKLEKELLASINKIKPQLLFVGFGAPIQEKWVYRWYNDMNIGGALVVGGTFDYISGKKPLPPKWVADLGLEWLWRLIKGDQTVRRIINAYPKFVLQIYLHKLKSGY